MSFLSRTPYEPHHPDVLAVYCSDGRFTEAVEELAEHLGHPKVDVMCRPGGPGRFDVWSSSVFDAAAMDEDSSFLVVGHHIRRVILVQHHECGFYGRRYPDLSPEARRMRQEEDARRAADRLRLANPGVEVISFFAVPRGVPARVAFDPVR